MWEAKHDSAGTVVLPDAAVVLLTNHRIAQKEARLKLGPAYKASGFVFTNTIGGQVDAGGLKRTWSAMKKRLGTEMRFHDSRHLHASLLIAQGVQAKVIQERLRHRHISTTMDVYGHLMPGMQEDAARKIDLALRSLKGLG